MFRTVAIFRKPLRLLLEYDDQYYACHVVCYIYIYIAETFSPGDEKFDLTTCLLLDTE